MLADLDTRKPDAVYCTGDLIGYNIRPNEIIAETRKRGIATLVGYHDLKTKGFAYELVTAENRTYLDTLPAYIPPISQRPANIKREKDLINAIIKTRFVIYTV